MSWLPSHLVVLIVALIVGAWLGSKYPQFNVLQKVTG
jgi:hypothetical protein